MKNSEQPAFPYPNNELVDAPQFGGLTKREYFAGLAMQGQITAWNSDMSKEHRAQSLNDMIEQSCKTADELLKQLESK